MGAAARRQTLAKNEKAAKALFRHAQAGESFLPGFFAKNCGVLLLQWGQAQNEEKG